MKEKTTFIVVMTWVVIAVAMVSMQIPHTVAVEVDAGGGILRVLFVFAPVNVILLAACVRGYWLKRRTIDAVLKYPKAVIGSFMIDAAALLGVAAGFARGAGAVQESQATLGHFLASGMMVMLFTLPLLALYRDSLKVDDSSPAVESGKTA